jgi:DNA-directed RNA polymerase sigma subunit (sigma70/sigma32)
MTVRKEILKLQKVNKQINNQQIYEIVEKTNRSSAYVQSVLNYMAGDFSLSAPRGDEESSSSWEDSLVSSDPSPEDIVVRESCNTTAKQEISRLITKFPKKSQDIFVARHLSNSPLTTLELAKIYNVSKQRIDQIEKNILGYLKKVMARKKHLY